MTDSVRVRDMPPEAFGALLRAIGPEVRLLASRGDQLATRVIARFMYAHNHPNEPQAILNVRTAVEDYVNRGLRTAELYELAGKYGHRLPEEDEQPTRVFVPGSPRPQ